MAELDGKVILITSSTDGIGKQTALELATMGATVIIHGRNKERAQTALNEIKQLTGSTTLEYSVADLASLQQVRSLAENIKERFSRLDVLINNAGIYLKRREQTEDGFEMTFAVNHLAHFLLTNLLLDLLKKSAPARIITVSSMVHKSAKFDFQNLNAENYFDPYGAYALSKLANVLFSNELAEQLIDAGVSSNSLHPGVIGTKLLRTAFNMTGASVKEGAATSIYLAVSPDIGSISGKYFVDKRETPAAPITNDADIRKRFWEASRTFVGL
jgi:NAD(P)-dependent dehydrogenase (short-subunit alcohol dehydrogenase family)